MDFRQKLLGLLEQGYSSKELSQATGIAYQSFYDWRHRRKPSGVKFSKLKVIDKPNQQLNLLFPSGTSIQGVSLADLVHLLKQQVL